MHIKMVLIMILLYQSNKFIKIFDSTGQILIHFFIQYLQNLQFLIIF